MTGLALTDRQRAMVRSAAAALPVATRVQFLQAVTDALPRATDQAALAPVPSNAMLQGAIRAALSAVAGQIVGRSAGTITKGYFTDSQPEEGTHTMSQYFRVDVAEDDAFEITAGKRVLKDKHGISVPMHMRDAAPRPVLVVDSALHRPGFRFSASDTGDQRQQAYDAYRHDLQNAWRIGDSRRKKVQARDPQGREAGTLEETEEEEERERRRRRRDGMTVDELRRDHQQRMAREYEAYNHWAEQQWRSP